jgi:hypothetical protein
MTLAIIFNDVLGNRFDDELLRRPPNWFADFDFSLFSYMHFTSTFDFSSLL